MPTILDGRAPPKGQSRSNVRPGPKPRGRTVTPVQRAALEARADVQQVSISAVIRQFIAIGLGAGVLYFLTALIEIMITCRTTAEVFDKDVHALKGVATVSAIAHSLRDQTNPDPVHAVGTHDADLPIPFSGIETADD